MAAVSPHFLFIILTGSIVPRGETSPPHFGVFCLLDLHSGKVTLDLLDPALAFVVSPEIALSFPLLLKLRPEHSLVFVLHRKKELRHLLTQLRDFILVHLIIKSGYNHCQ